MKKTPLFDKHVALGATMGDFGGWNMPLWYKTGQKAEHIATRENCGLFDICHMGEYIVKGPDSLSFLRKMFSNDVTKIVDGQAQYSFLLNEKGGVIDDCIVYRFNEKHWMLVVNAGSQDSDFEWLKANVSGDMTLENVSNEMGKLDLQGPKAPKLIADLVGREKIEGMKFFRFIPKIEIDGIPVLLSRTGYTGEIGFEIYCVIDDTEKLWEILMEKGRKYEVMPAGLGARDTLRLEAGLPLSGSEVKSDIPAVGTPWEFAMDYNHEFVGKEALEARKGKYFVYPFEVEGRRKPGNHSKIVVDGVEIGEVTSEILSVSLEMKPVGFMRVTKELEIGDGFDIVNARGKGFKGVVVANPMVKGTARKKMIVMLDK